MRVFLVLCPNHVAALLSFWQRPPHFRGQNPLVQAQRSGLKQIGIKGTWVGFAVQGPKNTFLLVVMHLQSCGNPK